MIAAFLLVSPTAFASTITTSSQGGIILPATTNVKSTSHAGFRDPVASISSVSVARASWIQPLESCQKGTVNAQVAFYVAITNGSTYVNVGTEGQCNNPSGTTTTIYKAFFEFSNWCIGNTTACGYANFVNSWSPTPGDRISATITRTTTSFTITITDVTKSQTFTQDCSNPPTHIQLSGACNAIVNSGSGTLVWGVSTWFKCNPTCNTQLVSTFGIATFGKDKTFVNGTNGATISGSVKTIKTASGTQLKTTLVAQSSPSTILASPSSLSSDGTSFAVTWKNAGP